MDDIISDSQKISRNAPCPCGSGKKFKKCCGASAVAAERAAEERRNLNWAPEGVTATGRRFAPATRSRCARRWARCWPYVNKLLRPFDEGAPDFV